MHTGTPKNTLGVRGNVWTPSSGVSTPGLSTEVVRVRARKCDDDYIEVHKDAERNNHKSMARTTHVGIVGGGVSGSTAALRLTELGLKVTLFEAGSSLVNGPPVCHLHAGGNLYREISDEQCIILLHQSIDTIRFFPHTINLRPTVIAIPKRDKGAEESILPRLELLQQAYAQLVAEDPTKEVLGKVGEYYKVYDREKMETLAVLEQPTEPATMDDWMIPVARAVNLDDFRFPFVMVQEYGISLFRVASTVEMGLANAPGCEVRTNCKVTGVTKLENGWKLTTEDAKGISCTSSVSVEVDYLINSCGYKTGTIDDHAQYHRHRMVEFKAAYTTHWPDAGGAWPEVIFHGIRGTPDGMGQLTPYAGGYFQLHGMTDNITLFREGLVETCDKSAQPQLPKVLADMAEHKWPDGVAEERTLKAIEHISGLLPTFASAKPGGNPLYGAQQIPGTDPSLRVADVSFERDRYARIEIVKFSSALAVADKIFHELQEAGLVPAESYHFEPESALLTSLCRHEIERRAVEIAVERGYPKELGSYYSATSY
jgi:hypothetical protein